MHDAIQNVLQSARRLLSLRVNFKDFFHQCGLNDTDMWHEDTACRHQRRDNLSVCHAFCSLQVAQELAHVEDGRIHACPFKHTELVVPVLSDNLYIGVLYAGPIWQSEKDAPYEGLAPARSRLLLADQLCMLRGFAREIAYIVQKSKHDPDNRRQGIYNFIQEHMTESLSVGDLAQYLQLSRSRCGHVIKELFQLTVPELIRQIKIQHAARLLENSNDSIKNIAQQCGILDSNYFARIFKEQFSCSASEFRAKKMQFV